MPVRLFRNARLLTMDPTLGDFARGDLLVEGERITAVGERLDVPRDAEVVDAEGRIIVPGFVDTHRHLWQGLLRGIGPAHTLQDYFDVVCRTYGPALTPEELYTGQLLSARAALGSGVTTVQDISNIQDTPERSDALVAALRDAGLRAVFAYGNSFPYGMAHGNALPDDVRRVRSGLLGDDRALVTMALITEGGSDDGELANAALAKELDLRAARHFFGSFSAARLRDIGALVPGTTFIHGNGMSAEELALVADTGGNVSVSAPIEMIMGHGYPMTGPARAVEGLTVTLSADVETTVSGDMFTQMRAAYQAARSAEHGQVSQQSQQGRRAGQGASDAGPVGVRDILRMATIEGARGLGLDDRTGSLTPGKDADLLVLRADRPDVAPVHDAYSTVVLQMDRSHVDTVLVAGWAHVRDGRSTADDGALLRDADAAVRRLGQRG
ncbi:amidohydrolase family protein [Streptomyces sp. ODS28]|uniref:amidohydrolase family protein n=1 Tax=Streptomyces sp. ODS28 TaxID=3136688 RepID=UPI0031E76FDA